jgi:hypothetical protein
MIGGCAVTEFGCCDDGTTSRANKYGSNCHSVMPTPSPSKKMIGGCAVTEFGCCDDGTTSRTNKYGTNCHYVMPVPKQWDCVLGESGASQSCKQTVNGPYDSLNDCIALAKCYKN